MRIQLISAIGMLCTLAGLLLPHDHTPSPDVGVEVTRISAPADPFCVGCESSTTGTTPGGTCGGTAIVITAGVVRHGECDSQCLTEKTCRFEWDVLLIVADGGGVRQTLWICPPAYAAAPVDPPCAKSVAYHTIGFHSEASGYDLQCNRSEQIIYNCIENPDGSGTALGRIQLNCAACAQQHN